MYKYILSILLLISSYCYSQSIVQVGCGEYFTGYRGSNGHVYNTQWINNTPQLVDFGLTGITDLDGAQYTGGCVGAGGIVYTLSNVAALVPTDTLGNPFTGNSKYYGWFTWNISLKSNGTVWMWGYNQTGSGANFLGINSHENNPVVKPFQLGQPSGKTLVKLVFVRFGTPTIYGLASDGTVWQWQNSITPTQVTFTGVASDIGAIGSGVCIIRTGTDVLAFGTFASYVGLSNNVSTPTSILSTWTGAGVTFPLIKMVGNYNTLQIIDANHDRYTCGSNVCGEFGNGLEYNPYRLRPTTTWQWNLNSGELVQSIVKQQGKWADVQTSTTFAFYVYGQDMGGNWYSWGRNKALSLGNATTLSINDYAVYANNKDIPAPRLVTPLNISWTVAPIDTGAMQHPRANAGINQYITTATANLSATTSSQQLSCTILSYQWFIISGNGGSLTTPTASTTTLTGLTNGIYNIRVLVTNNCGLTDQRDMVVYVSGVPATNPADTIRTTLRFIQAVNINRHHERIDFGSTKPRENTQYWQALKRYDGFAAGGITGQIKTYPSDSTFTVVDLAYDRTKDTYYSVLFVDKDIRGFTYYTYSKEFLVKKNTSP